MRESQPLPYRPSQGGRLTGQRGAAAFLLMALLGLATGVLVIGHMRSVQGDTSADGRTTLALAQAREALVGYAATYRDFHPGEAFGYLPCPDWGTGIEGQSLSNCGSVDVTVIGRLPWKSLGIPPLRDASGECLWYAVSGNFKTGSSKTKDLLNRDTNGLIEVMAADGTGFVAGASPRQRAVAVVFSPGAILPGQDRSLATTNPPTVCGGNYVPANYLDSDVASSIDNAAAPTTANALSQFIAAEHSDRTSATNDAFNDQLMPVFPDEIFAQHLDQRRDFESYLTDPLTGLLRRSADCLLAYGNSNDGGVYRKYLPWAAQLTIPSFGNSLDYIDTDNNLSGRLPRTAFNTANSSYGSHNNANYKTTPLLGTPQCPGWDQTDEFWEQWKDHLFYAVARAHQVPHHHAHSEFPCSHNECLDVEDPDGIKTGFAAVVIFAGAAQSNQNRDNDANPSYASSNKANPANYLEGVNVTSIDPNDPSYPTNSSAPNRLFSKIAGNDSIMCLQSINFGARLDIDPTCGTSARCVADGTLLAAYRSGVKNNCRTGTSGINSTCQTIANRIDINNCPGAGATYSCERAARDFLSYDCLLGFASNECQLAHSTLTTCS